MPRFHCNAPPTRGCRATSRGAAHTGAFTFVELMVVLTIISILAAIAVPNFLEAQTRTVVSRSYAEQALVYSALETYRLEHRAYPPNANPGVAAGWDLFRLTTPVPYLTTLPLDPFTMRENLGRSANKMSMARQPYHYLNGLQLDAKDGLRLALIDSPKNAPWDSPPHDVDAPTTASVWFGGFRGVHLWGYGPTLDMLQATGKGDVAPLPAGASCGITEALFPPATLSIMIYDPTNGTTSRGSIHRLN